MRSVKSLVAAGAASLLSTAAFAADMPSIMPPPPMYAPPPIQEFGGWYLAAISASATRASSASTTCSTRQQPHVPTSAWASTAAALPGSASATRSTTGSAPTSPASIAATANFNGLDVIKFKWRASATASILHRQQVRGAVLANAYVDLGTWWCMTPFVGAGIGPRGSDKLQRTAEHEFRLAPGVGGAGPALPPAIPPEWKFAWAIPRGPRLQGLAEHDARTRLSLRQHGRRHHRRRHDLRRQQGHVFKVQEITSQDLMLGVRWNSTRPPRLRAAADPQGLIEPLVLLRFLTARDFPAPFSFARRGSVHAQSSGQRARDNDWLRLTGDDQRQVRVSMERCDA